MCSCLVQEVLTEQLKEQQELDRQINKMSKRLDHLERAFREEEAPLLLQAEQERIEEERKMHQQVRRKIDTPSWGKDERNDMDTLRGAQVLSLTGEPPGSAAKDLMRNIFLSALLPILCSCVCAQRGWLPRRRVCGMQRIIERRGKLMWLRSRDC